MLLDPITIFSSEMRRDFAKMIGAHLIGRHGRVCEASPPRHRCYSPAVRAMICFKSEPTMGVSLQLIGGFRAVRDDGRVVPRCPDRSRALLAHLALAVTPIQRTVLADVLSPDECRSGSAFGTCGQAVAQFATRSATRQSLAPIAALFALIIKWSGRMFEFRRVIACGDEKSLVRAIELYQGAFLQGETCRSSDAEDWLARRREHLEEVINALLQVSPA